MTEDEKLGLLGHHSWCDFGLSRYEQVIVFLCALRLLFLFSLSSFFPAWTLSRHSAQTLMFPQCFFTIFLTLKRIPSVDGFPGPLVF